MRSWNGNADVSCIFCQEPVETLLRASLEKVNERGDGFSVHSGMGGAS